MAQLSASSLPQIYAELMRQIKRRIAVIDRSLSRTMLDGEKDFAFGELEACYLQLRFCVELVALAILIAHNEFDDFRKKAVVKEWKAADLLANLESLSPDAFPVYFEIEKSEESPDHSEIIVDFAADEDRKMLLKIYTNAGKQLHVGSLRALLRTGKRYESAEIAAGRNFIVRLLNNHAIVLPGMQKVILTSMHHDATKDVVCQIVPLESAARIDLQSARRRSR